MSLIHNSRSLGPACSADFAFVLARGGMLIGAWPNGPRNMSFGGPSYCSTSAGCAVGLGPAGFCSRAWKDARSPAVAVFILVILHRAYTWSASKIREAGVVFTRKGAYVLRASAASKANNQSLLSGQKPVSRSGDNCSALSNCFQFQLNSAMPSIKSSFVEAHCLVISMKSLVRASPLVVEGVGGGQKEQSKMNFRVSLSLGANMARYG